MQQVLFSSAHFSKQSQTIIIIILFIGKIIKYNAFKLSHKNTPTEFPCA